MTVAIPISPEPIAAFCRNHSIRRLALFGSVLRADFGSESDVDVLVEYEPGLRITYLDMAAQAMELERIFHHPVDLREPEELSRYFRENVLALAETIYE